MSCTASAARAGFPPSIHLPAGTAQSSGSMCLPHIHAWLTGQASHFSSGIPIVHNTSDICEDLSAGLYSIKAGNFWMILLGTAVSF